MANDLWNRNLVIGADRGKIITSDNKVIADNLTTVSLVIVPNQVKDKDKVVHDIANILNVDEEEALNKSTKKFVKRFNFIEESIVNQGKSLSESTIDEMNALWEDSKKYD